MSVPSLQRPVDFVWLVPLVLVVHAAGGWVVLSKRSEPLDAAPRIMEASIGPSPAQEPPQAQPVPPRPNPPPAPRRQPRPSSAPTAVARAPAPLALPAAAQTHDAPAVTVPRPEPAPPAPAQPAAPAPIVPPSFSAAYLENPPPAYPATSRRLGETGRVVLRVRVGTEGRADAVELATSSGFERLDRAALEAVKRWRFVPARQAGAPVAAWVRVPLSFNLDN